MFASERIANPVVAPTEQCQDVWGGLAPKVRDTIEAHSKERGRHRAACGPW